MKKRVVITGMGVVAPNGVGIEEFMHGIRTGRSGIKYIQELKDLGFSCCIGGVPELSDDLISRYLTDLQRKNFNSSGILYGCISGMDAWMDAGLGIDRNSEVDYDTGIIFGTGQSGVEKFREAIYKLDDNKVRRLGSTTVAQTMASGISAYLGGILGCGNQVTTNSSACTTGTESILMGAERIRSGKARRMLVGSSSDHGPYIWGGFDAMRVMTYKYNDSPQKGSRPMSSSASGFVPGSGAGAMVLEDLESALGRGAKIYAEILGGHINAGGQRQGGTMTAPNASAVKKCIREAVNEAGIDPDTIDSINGHLTATTKDVLEIRNWKEALGCSSNNFPYINSVKSMTGHCLAAAGSIECVASVLQIHHGFLFPSVNSEDLHPDIVELINPSSVPGDIRIQDVSTVIKASFGFGDVNACIVFRKLKN
ncbi:beta-ketoacyl-[acyl-carrier-protein] synthase family protein [Lutimonas zeaxanthinifaciens]|uniref:beta-ketoacyl-[acyl-carrier-protein] synthase family protein n=1 Tax=Lutimonas zeaxanthinifaciens TaxID=3060215 RepID=UPI00265D3157|nr:beta-ketoacyl-[acyl-carrier-protein] synthase family protein [Lutimonas sp. YSD2104]WKK64900.1 beta-ketoacyl-[acyl-carrier-protein] synthase family protein [Lutimonas sp. YSD2104]